MESDTTTPVQSNTNESSTNTTPAKALSLEVLREIKTSQNQHGLRHSDYQRYRKYCTRRLRRIRKVLGITHGKTKFQKKSIDAEKVSDVRYLLYCLVKAERAWSFAMSLKDEAAANTRIRVHMHKKLAKAVGHAKFLESICNAKSDKITILECEAYSSWMVANLELVKESWSEALQNYNKSKTIYEQLGKVGEPEYQELCKQRLEEIEPSVRYCNYKLKGKRTGEAEKSTDDILQAKLDSVISDTLKKKAETMRDVTWRGQKIAIKNEKVRQYILAAQETEIELERMDTYEKKVPVYDKLFVTYNDAIRVIKDDLTGLAAKKKTDQEESLQNLKLYVTHLKIQKTIEKNLLLADSLEKRLNVRADEEQKAAKPEEIVRVYEALFQNVQELSELKLEEQAKEVAAKTVTFKALRCFYVALSYLHTNKFNEAFALFDRAREQLRAAHKHHESCAQPSQEFLNKISEVENRIRSYKCETHAKKFLESIASNKPEQTTTTTPVEAPQEAKPEEENSEVEEISVDTSNSLLNKINSFDYSFAQSKQLIAFPPALELTKCKPLLFDLAFSACDFPDLSERKKSKGGSGFWGFWR